MPMGEASARELEICIQNEKDRREQKQKLTKKEKKALPTNKQIKEIAAKCAEKRFPNEDWKWQSFIDIAVKAVKGDQIKLSLDYLPPNDF